ncbi:hypothetical protein [Rhodococcus sp. UNC363MFTsu5.1]|uniref:hypothetical protein n=1 Tax=Rhodococcus sp. UNC363MFTsu5.1 TaxID=1449069 RepID=UPI0012DF3C7A|nr:hypothetical protein [Rhodococcus sp. UNC363MFTsu5.1]
MPNPTLTVLGVDPGGRSTGLCLIDGRDVIAHRTVENAAEKMLPIAQPYIADVLNAIAEMYPSPNDSQMHYSLPVLAVEDVVRPSWHMKGRAAVDPSALLATAAVLGAVLAFDPHAHPVQVRPSRNGSRPLGEYPATLVSAAERRGDGWQHRIGSGQLRHARSAYDVALAGAAQHLNGAIK